MIRTSRLVALFCGVAALGLHGMGLGVSETPEAIAIEGGGTVEASLGSSFADMASGTAQPVTATATKAAEPEETPPTARARTPAVTATQAVTPTRPDIAKAATPDRVKATPGSEQAVETSLRPQSRPRPPERATARQKTKPEPRQSASSRAGNNATRDATRGSTSARETASPAQTTGQVRARSTAEGNAAASNYPGKVMRHLARVLRPRSKGRGAALVRFTIDRNGGLSAVGLARSSGSDRLDRAALTVVQRAAPFPAPPQGATRSYSIKIEGR